MYNIAMFAVLLGNPLDDTLTTNVMYFSRGRCVSLPMSNRVEADRAEDFIARVDGKHQLYTNVNPARIGTKGKPRDVDIPQVSNLYVDIDVIKLGGAKRNPATDCELADVPLEKIMCAIDEKYCCAWVEFTGNGWRVIIPVKNAVPDDERRLVTYIHNLFPDYIDVSVKDPSRVTGVPGTMNVKTETHDRRNRRRDAYDVANTRNESLTAIYSPDEIAEPQKTPLFVRSRTDQPANAVVTDVDTRRLLRSYLIDTNITAPHILKILSSAPDTDTGLWWDSMFACEIANKIGDVPEVFTWVCKIHWGSDYDAEATRAVWKRTIAEGVGAWSNATIARRFGVKP